jgi:hypothetical protein
MKTALQIIFFVSAPVVAIITFMGVGMSGGFSPSALFWLILAIPVGSGWGWWRIRRSELTGEDIENSR